MFGDSPTARPSHAPAGRPRTRAGFTLVELMVVVLIAAILLAVGVPALQSFIARNQLDAVTDGFASVLSEARSEAAKLGTNVQLASSASGTDWSAGWTMAATPPVAGVPNPLHSGATLPAGYSLRSTVPSVTFDPTGHLVAGAGGEFVVCQGSGPAAGGLSKMILVAAAGGVRIAQTDPSSGYPFDANGNPFSGCTPPPP